jgi:hypothetical protein
MFSISLTSVRYCAKFLGTNWDDLVLAAGTVFNQVVLWAICGEKKEGFSKVLHRLAGHQVCWFFVLCHNEL